MTAYQRIGREQRERQEARAARMKQGERTKRRHPRRVNAQNTWSQNADHVDGFDRDDLGLSHDMTHKQAVKAVRDYAPFIDWTLLDNAN